VLGSRARCCGAAGFRERGGAAATASAAYPDHPVRGLIGFTAGGRSTCRPHHGAMAHGAVLLLVAPSNAISTSLYKKLPSTSSATPVPVASIMQLTNMMVVSNAMPTRAVQGGRRGAQGPQAGGAAR
jgi:hypothetical protein